MTGSETTTNKETATCPMCGDDPCEFCSFLEEYRERRRAQGIRDAGFQKASKIVRRLEDGSEELVAWMPFRDGQAPFSIHGCPEEHHWKHGMVVLAEPDAIEPGYFEVVRILRDGV